MENLSNLSRVTGQIWGAALTQFLCFFMSLSSFPAIPCSVSLVGSSFSPAWFCSPGIIFAFGFGDLVGRLLCQLPSVDGFLKGSVRLNSAGLARLILLAIILACSLGGAESPALPWIVLVTMLFFGISNGIVSTLSMMRAPLLVADKDRENAAQIMVLFLYSGIAAGTITAALLHMVNLV